MSAKALLELIHQFLIKRFGMAEFTAFPNIGNILLALRAAANATALFGVISNPMKSRARFEPMVDNGKEAGSLTHYSLR